MPDGLHPSDKGARRIAERLYGFFCNVIDDGGEKYEHNKI